MLTLAVAAGSYLYLGAEVTKPDDVQTVYDGDIVLTPAQLESYTRLKHILDAKGSFETWLEDENGGTPTFQMFEKTGVKRLIADKIKQHFGRVAPDVDPVEYGGGQKGLQFKAKKIRLDLDDPTTMSVRVTVAGANWSMALEKPIPLAALLKTESWKLGFPSKEEGPPEGVATYSAHFSLRFDTTAHRWVVEEATCNLLVEADNPIPRLPKIREADSATLRNLKSGPIPPVPTKPSGKR